MEISESRSKPWFLNVSGNQFLVDCLKLTLIVSVVIFVAFITLLIVFPKVFQNYAKRSKAWRIWDLAQNQSQIINELSQILSNLDQ